ncbi:M56 family metallopeptidase [Flavobacteriaceae bacterium 14752]|uniref:M56 family metallopeptidase n=1 Tax=Mesohalobacter salilacus TaxID=2491711 RepID=UPI000F633A0B|nr:M56 family metallopeptidase [Flavobacteriaceae bacterium 14752]
MDTLIYFLKSSVLLILFYVVYHVLLKRDTYHQFKRIYLLSGLILSAVLPWIYYTKTVVVPKNNFSEAPVNIQSIAGFSEVSNLGYQAKDIFTLSWNDVLLMVYVLVGLVLLARFVYQFFKLHKLLRQTAYKTIDSYKLHIVDNSVNPFSFFKHILISRADYESENFKMIFAHEKVHINQYHSVDILLANLYCVLFWFNPFVWIYKKSLVQNLEHIADDISVKTLSDKVKYQYLLLNHTFQDNHFQSLQTTFFQSSIKQRIMMLNKSTTAKIYALKSIVVLPILVLLFINFQSKILAQEKESKDDKTVSYSIKYWDDFKPSLISPKKNPFDVNNYTVAPTFIDNNTFVNDSLRKDERVVVKINRYAGKEYLEHTKRFLKKSYNIDVNYSDLKYNDKNELISIQAKVDCNDGFSGTIARKNNQPVEEFYIYRDYSTAAEIPFGVGDNLPSSLTGGKTSKNSTQVTHRTSVILSPSMKGIFEVNFKDLPETSDVTTATANKVNLKNVKTFIINGKSFELSEIKSKFMVVDNYEFIDDETFKANGELVNGDNYFDYLKSQSEDKKEIYVENIDVIMFSDNKATFYHLKEVAVTQEKSEKE